MGPAKSRDDVVISITPRRKIGDLENLNDLNAIQAREIDEVFEPMGSALVGELCDETGLTLERVLDHVNYLIHQGNARLNMQDLSANKGSTPTQSAPNVITSAVNLGDTRFAIVVARWNETITRKLLDGAVSTLKEQGIADDAIDVAWVPGSMELPLVAQRFAASGRYAAVICLGVVIRGETTHDQHINRAVSSAITQIALQTNIPVLFGVLTCETMDQAIERAGGDVGNKGAECAEAAVQMAGLMKNLPS